MRISDWSSDVCCSDLRPLRGLGLRYLATPQHARAGEAATITIEARAEGATAAQFPEIELPSIDGAQVFAEPAQVDETFDNGRPSVKVTRKFSIVPSRSGALRIPGPRIAWWDVRAAAARTDRTSTRLNSTH